MLRNEKIIHLSYLFVYITTINTNRGTYISALDFNQTIRGL